MSREDTLRQTVKKFDLIEDVVEGYLAEYWKQIFSAIGNSVADSVSRTDRKNKWLTKNI